MMHKMMKSDDSDKELLTAFKVFDKEGNGFISQAELRHILTNFDKKMSDEDVDKLFEIFPWNEEGKFDYKKFIDENK